MKHTAGYAKPRRVIAPTRSSRLNLQRRPKPEPEDGIDSRQEGQFWKWVIFVAALHILVIGGAYLFFLLSPTAKPEDHFMSLLPPGDTVKGTLGVQQAHKLGANTPAAPSHHAAPPPPAAAAPSTPKVVTPPPVVKPPPTQIIKENAPPITPVKPSRPKPAPSKPKVKVDLHLVDGPATDEPTPKPAKHHAKKPEKHTEESQDDAESSPDNTGLTKEQIAEKLGDKLNASGSKNAIKSGKSGAPDGHENKFGEFYDLIGQQVHEEWNSPMTPADTDPIVGIHVERDGHVPPESVHLIRSSGDSTYDQAALDTVKRLGYLHEPLPDGCPPDISLDFKPNP
jgi:hypothetical protein